MSGVEIGVRPMEAGDLAAVEEIQRRNPAAAQWHVQDYLEQMGWVAEAGGRVVGFLVTRRVAPGESEILNIAVDPDWQRRGVAGRLLEPVLGAGDVYLEVRESNRAARVLYRKWGFEETGRRRGYYRNPDEDGLILHRRAGADCETLL